MNLENVKNYTIKKLESYTSYYPAEIFQGVKVETSGGSFGSCLLTITYDNGNPHNLATINYRYVGNYSAVDSLVSDFVVRNYELMASRVFEKHQKEKAKGLYCKLEIFNNNDLVNVFEFTEPEQVKSELVKILIADKRRGTKTTYKPVPYTNDIKIIEKWSREQAGTTCNIKYIYHFKNIDY